MHSFEVLLFSDDSSYTPVTVTSSVPKAALIFSRHVSTTDVSFSEVIDLAIKRALVLLIPAPKGAGVNAARANAENIVTRRTTRWIDFISDPTKKDVRGL